MDCRLLRRHDNFWTRVHDPWDPFNSLESKAVGECIVILICLFVLT
jgi:hypothetical protein